MTRDKANAINKYRKVRKASKQEKMGGREGGRVGGWEGGRGKTLLPLDLQPSEKVVIEMIGIE